MPFETSMDIKIKGYSSLYFLERSKTNSANQTITPSSQVQNYCPARAILSQNKPQQCVLLKKELVSPAAKEKPNYIFYGSIENLDINSISHLSHICIVSNSYTLCDYHRNLLKLNKSIIYHPSYLGKRSLFNLSITLGKVQGLCFEIFFKNGDSS